EASILFEERETERAGGAPAEGTLTDVQSALRPELLAQLAHVRGLLKDELSAVAEGEACLTCSFQAEDVLLLHLAMELRPDIPVLFLDTNYHFRETYEYRDRLASEWKLNLTNLLPKETVQQQESQFGLLYNTDPNRCCGLRKVEPLFAAVAGYKVWLTGLRREQARSRTALKEIDDFVLPSGTVVRKLSPFADWTTRDVWQLAEHFGIPLLPLYDQGYTSIGCQPCTTLPTDPNDPRSGRWAGKKVECGIHIQATDLDKRT
ncbi:MAG: phosphoadenylyl-sulfate reductase, partial [Janthinobacterium lividum]